MRYRRLITYVANFALGSLLISCANPAARQGANIANVRLQGSGSPFRVQASADGHPEYHLISTPAVVSEAVGQLQHDILADIAQNEMKHGGKAAPKLLETRAFPGARHGTREIWLVDRNGQTIAYIITMAPSPSGGTDFRLQGGVPVIL